MDFSALPLLLHIISKMSFWQCVELYSSFILGGSTLSAVLLLSLGLGHLGHPSFSMISHTPVHVTGHSRTQGSVAGSEIPGSHHCRCCSVYAVRSGSRPAGFPHPVRHPHGHTATLWVQNSILLGLGVHFPLHSCQTCFAEQTWHVSMPDVFRSTSSGRVTGATQVTLPT